MPLVRIRLQVVESIVIPNAMVKDIFVSVGANSKHRRRSGEVPLPVVFVQDVVAPTKRPTLEQRQERCPIHRRGLRWLHSRRRQKRWGDVDILNHLRDLRTRLDQARSVGEHRHAD